jgi:adenine-specific DNA-methyltransferase
MEKLTGGFYTPDDLADFILKWAVNGNAGFDILEPSAGDGVFFRRIKAKGIEYKSVTAVEIDKKEAQKIPALPRSKVVVDDFHTYCNTTDERFNLAIGNPPFIRYQYFDKEQRAEAEKIFQRAGLRYSKLTNPWVSFIVGSSLLLKDQGKIGFVVPAEILQVAYAAELRSFLARFYNKIAILSFRKLIFPAVQQEVVLLFCEKTLNGSHMIEHVELEDAEALKTVDMARLKSPQKRIEFQSKWTFYFLDQSEIDFIESILDKKRVPTLGEHAKVEVGMTTGSNQFFTVPLSTVEEYGLSKYAKPMVGRSVQIRGAIVDEDDWRENIKAGTRAFFLKFPPIKELQKDEEAMKYVHFGEKQDIGTKYYKTRIRGDEWHVVPSAWVSQALFQRRNNVYPKFVVNKADAYTTDTMHRVTPDVNVDLDGLVASYYNSLSLASAEICGRSHGGGALELMPNEVERVLVPYREENARLLQTIDQMFREGRTIHEVLSFTDPIVLKDGYGFLDSEIAMSNRIWKKLLSRRLSRGKGKNGTNRLPRSKALSVPQVGRKSKPPYRPSWSP